MKNFKNVVSRFKREIRSRVRRRTTVDVFTSVDFNTVMVGIPTRSRGLVVSTAFRDLVEEGFLAVSKHTVRNPRNRHQVKAYVRGGLANAAHREGGLAPLTVKLV